MCLRQHLSEVAHLSVGLCLEDVGLVGVPPRVKAHHQAAPTALRVAIPAGVLGYYGNVLEGAKYQPVPGLLGHCQDSLVEGDCYIFVIESCCHDVSHSG